MPSVSVSENALNAILWVEANKSVVDALKAYPYPTLATTVVAASNASARTKARADYVCDGTADNEEIQEAIDALPTAGGEVYLSEGTFNVIAAPKINKSGVHLRGAGYATRIFVVAGYQINGIEVTAGSSHIYGITISDLQVDGNKANQAASGNQYLQNGIALLGISGTQRAQRIIVQRIFAHDNIYSGISNLGYTWHVQVLDNHCYSNGLHGIRGDADTRLTIVGNFCYENTHSGIYIDAGGHCTITANRTQGNSGFGIAIVGAGYGNTIVGNHSLNDRRGIHCTGKRSTVTGNTVISPTATGIYLGDTGCPADYSTLVGNVIYRAPQLAVNLTGDYMLVAENIIIDPSYGNAYPTHSYYGIIWGVPLIGTKVINNIVRDTQGNCRWCISNGFYCGELSGNHLSGAGQANLRNVNYRTSTYDQREFIILEEHFQDVLAVTANHIVAAQDLTAETPITCTLAAQPDVPRNVTIVITDANNSITAFQITVKGVTPQGEYNVSEVFTQAGGKSQVGSRAYARIISVIVDSVTGAGEGDVLNVGIGRKFGLGHPIVTPTIAYDTIFKVKKNNADVAIAGVTVSYTYATFDPSAINAGDDLTVWYKYNQNVI